MLKYPLKCAPARISKQPMIEQYVNFLDVLLVSSESCYIVEGVFYKFQRLEVNLFGIERMLALPVCMQDLVQHAGDVRSPS